MRQRDRRFQWIPDYVQQIPLALKTSLADRKTLRMNEDQSSKLFGLGPERMEFGIR